MQVGMAWGGFLPSFMELREWDFPSVMSPWICLNIEKHKSGPQAPQPVEDIQLA